MWFDGPLRLVDEICLKSMVANGLEVSLYTYGDVPNLPQGITLRDGEEILNSSYLSKLQPVAKREYKTWLPTVQFSDLFRVMLQKYERGLWLDTDVFIFRPFSYPTHQVFFAKENFFRIGASVWYLPPGNQIIAEYERLLAQDVLLPNWLGVRRGFVKPRLYELTKTDYSPSDLGITIYGNDGFSRLTKRYNCFSDALPKSSFYHWASKENEKVFKSVNYRFFLESENYIGLHIHRKFLASSNPEKNSLWEWMLRSYR